MFKKLANIFTKEHIVESLRERSESKIQDLELAVGAVLLEASGRDHDYAPEEVETIFKLMKRELGLQDAELTDILEVADVMRRDKHKVDEYFKSLVTVFSASEREVILEMVRKVILADGRIDTSEDRYFKQVTARLQLSEEQAEKVKRKLG